MTTYQATNHAQMANFIHGFTCIYSRHFPKPEPDPNPGFCGLPNPKPGFSKKAPGLESPSHTFTSLQVHRTRGEFTYLLCGLYFYGVDIFVDKSGHLRLEPHMTHSWSGSLCILFADLFNFVILEVKVSHHSLV